MLTEKQLSLEFEYIPEKNLSSFFKYMRDRHSIYLKRCCGHPYPWTSDPVFLKYRFCNVFRSDDKVTDWIINKVLSRHSHIFEDLTPERLQRLIDDTILFRFISRIESMELVISSGWFEHRDYSISKDYVLDNLNGRAFCTGSVIINTPAGMDKVTGVFEIAKTAHSMTYLSEQLVKDSRSRTIERVSSELSKYRFFGPFMSYEVATDLTYTDLLRDAPDTMTWANIGPGCYRGLTRLLSPTRSLDNKHIKKVLTPMNCLGLMSQLLDFSKNEDYWPSQYQQLCMRDIEHTLCEYDKYIRCLNNEGTTRLRFKYHD